MNGQRSSNILTILRNNTLNQNTLQYRNLHQLTRQGIDLEDFMVQEAIRQSMLTNNSNEINVHDEYEVSDTAELKPSGEMTKSNSSTSLKSSGIVSSILLNEQIVIDAI